MTWVSANFSNWVHSAGGTLRPGQRTTLLVSCNPGSFQLADLTTWILTQKNFSTDLSISVPLCTQNSCTLASRRAKVSLTNFVLRKTWKRVQFTKFWSYSYPIFKYLLPFQKIAHVKMKPFQLLNTSKFFSESSIFLWIGKSWQHWSQQEQKLISMSMEFMRSLVPPHRSLWSNLVEKSQGRSILWTMPRFVCITRQKIFLDTFQNWPNITIRKLFNSTFVKGMTRFREL